MSTRRGRRLGYVVVNLNPVGEPSIVAGTEGRIYPTEEAADREARRLQDAYRNPWIAIAELVLPPEPDVQVNAKEMAQVAHDR